LGTNEILAAPPLSPATLSATQRNEHMSTKNWIDFFIHMYPLSKLHPKKLWKSSETPQTEVINIRLMEVLSAPPRRYTGGLEPNDSYRGRKSADSILRGRSAVIRTPEDCAGPPLRKRTIATSLPLKTMLLWMGLNQPGSNSLNPVC
jgi:hypothetical protein